MAGKNLVIVESPGKVKTIQGYLGKDYLVKASIGHIRDLEEHKLSVDIEHGFKPEYVIPAAKKKVVAELRTLAKGAETVWLASDEDREGEAISWHLKETLDLPPEKTRRIVFHEITKNAILKAIESPRDIDMHLVDAQQARRVLDRLVGFELSPVLWRKIQPKLSAGRVQSVALRLIVDREKEIMAFGPEPFYKVEGQFKADGSRTAIKASLEKKLDTQADARKFLEDSKGAIFSVKDIEQKDGNRYPAPPFTTSTLQQEAARKLHFPVATTMRIAQGLYERGLITYMRTDSTNLSAVALAAAKQLILDNFGPEYSHPRQYQTHSKGAQEAHEAIRPTHLENTAIDGSAQEQKLYDLIWKRTLASQMSESRVLTTTVTIASDRRPELFTAQATKLLFDGFMKVYLEGRDDEDNSEKEQVLPNLQKGQSLNAIKLDALGKYTAPPARYSEASLVKKLEELGIGRPSTYAATVDTLTRGRGYAVKGNKDGRAFPVTDMHLQGEDLCEEVRTETVGAEKGKLLPQEIGIVVTDYLTRHFSEVVNYDFTAKVEADFDQVAAGQQPWSHAIAAFYGPFHQQIQEVLQDRNYQKVTREIGIAPDGDKVIASFGKFGPYVQKGEGERRQSASLQKGQLIETLTMEEALKLLELPRRVGSLDGVAIVATTGRYGPYLKYGAQNVKLPRGADPFTITLEDCEKLIKEAGCEKAAPKVLAEFGDIQLIDGRYGPYLKQGSSNFRLPKGANVATLSEADCQAIISSSEPTKKSGKGRRK